jgi:hypothetical protein
MIAACTVILTAKSSVMLLTHDLQFRPRQPTGEPDASSPWPVEAASSDLPFHTGFSDGHDSPAGKWATDFRAAFPNLTDFGFCFSSYCWHVWVSSIAVAVGCVRITLDRFIDLMPMHRHISRGCNAEANFVAPDINDHHADVVADHDFLI